MKDNTQRNRNTGISKQEQGRNNSLTLPKPVYKTDGCTYYEQLGKYTQSSHTVNGQEIIFIIEDTYKDFYHACSIDDVLYVLKEIPEEDFGELKFIIFRQPKRKEQRSFPVWGRLIYSYEFEKEYYPAIILEAVPKDGVLKWNKKEFVEFQKEFNRLKSDGHCIVEENGYYQIILSPEAVRNTLLYRTLPHEIGHYVHYLEIVERPIAAIEKIDFDKYLNEMDKKWNYFHNSIPTVEKETFAHKYAAKIREKLL
ncbi:MAG: hypothetical protein LUH15_17865 [Tannerellaceae bacterium]|nr:hypothetical protein [Tannerellaceae bacterium]